MSLKNVHQESIKAPVYDVLKKPEDFKPAGPTNEIKGM